MDLAFNYAEKLNRNIEEKSPNFQPTKGYFDKEEPDRFNDFWMEHDPEYRRRFTESVVRKVLKENFEQLYNKLTRLPAEQNTIDDLYLRLKENGISTDIIAREFMRKMDPADVLSVLQKIDRNYVKNDKVSHQISEQDLTKIIIESVKKSFKIK